MISHTISAHSFLYKQTGSRYSNGKYPSNTTAHDTNLFHNNISVVCPTEYMHK